MDDMQAALVAANLEIDRLKLVVTECTLYNRELKKESGAWWRDHEDREEQKRLNKERGPGGWMPRCAPLVAAAYNWDQGEANSVAMTILRGQPAIWLEHCIQTNRCFGGCIKLQSFAPQFV